MAVKFLDGITVNSGSGSAATIIAEGARPITITGGAIGSVAIKGSNGGYATGYFFTGYSGTFRGGFGALGNGNNLSYYFIGDAYNDTTMVVQPNAGNVGIGTTSPDSKLEVIGNYKQKAADGNSQGFTLSINSSTDAVSLNNYYNASMTFSTNNSAKMTILGSGNVGIGTTSPGYKLTVAGTIVSTAASNPQLILQDTTHSIITIKGDSGIFSVTNQNVGQNITMLYSGNVGIGTTVPVGKLEVAGNFRLSGNGTNNDSYPIHFTNTSVAMARDDNNLELHAYNAIVFGASTTSYPTSTERMRILNNGYVGIGVTGPVNKLGIGAAYSNSNTKAINIYSGNTSPGAYTSIGSQYSVSNTYIESEIRFGNETQNGGSSYLGFVAGGSNSGNTEKMRITSGGNVGIGTTLPAGKFEIKSAANNYTTAPAITFTDDADVSDSRWILGNIAVTNYGNFVLAEAEEYDGVDYSPRITVIPGGNVGIGTTSPGAKLDLDSNTNWSSAWRNNLRLTSDLYPCIRLYSETINKTSFIGNNNDGGLWFYVNGTGNTATGGNYAMTMLPTGNIGIGILSPAAKLDVSQEARISYAAGNQYRVRITDTDGNGRILVDGQESALIFGTSAATANATATEKMRISSSGNVGIGNTAPTTKLEVNGRTQTKGINSIYIGNLTLPVALGWYRVMEWTGSSRGGSVMCLSLTGGNFAPVTYIIKAYKTYGSPAGYNTLKLEQFGGSVYIDKARIAYDSELGKSFVEVYRSYGGSNTMPFQVHQDKLIGYDATSTALVGTAAAGGGQVMEELSFVAEGTSMETLLISDFIKATSYKSSDGSAGITTTVGVKNAAQSQNITLTIKNGIITGASSDRRLKTNITLIGTSDSIEGVGLFQGVMSDEVPDHAVSVDVHGFDVVDYSVLDVEFKRVSI